MSLVIGPGPFLLLLISAALACWGGLGMVEYVFPDASFGLQNPGFPAGTQFLHFLALLGTGLSFIIGYRLRWAHTPFVTITMYAVLATLCFVETVDFYAFGDGNARFVPMVLEYLVYIALAVYLLKSPAMRRRFSGPPGCADDCTDNGADKGADKGAQGA